MSQITATRLAIVTACIGAAVLVLILYPRPGTQPGGGVCRELPVVAHISDVAMDNTRGVAYLAYLDAQARPGGRPARGTVMLLDLNVSDPAVRAALVTEPPNFQPVALSLYAPESGPRHLFVVDRGSGGQSTVRIFEQSPSGAFDLVKSVQDALLVNPVAITATGPDKFYVRVKPQGLLARLRAMLGSTSGAVAYYDGSRVSAATTVERMVISTGIEPQDGVFENARTHRRLQVIEREARSELLLCTASAVSISRLVRAS